MRKSDFVLKFHLLLQELNILYNMYDDLENMIEQLFYELEGTSATQYNFDNIINEVNHHEVNLKRQEKYDLINEYEKERQKLEKRIILIESLRAKLPEREETIAILKYADKEKKIDIALEVGLSERSVYDVLDKAIEKLYETDPEAVKIVKIFIASH